MLVAIHCSEIEIETILGELDSGGYITALLAACPVKSPTNFGRKVSMKQSLAASQHIVMAGRFSSAVIKIINKLLNRCYFKNEAAKNTDRDDVMKLFGVRSDWRFSAKAHHAACHILCRWYLGTWITTELNTE